MIAWPVIGHEMILSSVKVLLKKFLKKKPGRDGGFCSSANMINKALLSEMDVRGACPNHREVHEIEA